MSHDQWLTESLKTDRVQNHEEILWIPDPSLAHHRYVPLQQTTFHNSLALMISSFSPEGRMLTGWSSLARSDLPPEVYKKVITGDIGIQEEVDVPLEAASMRLGVQDQMNSHLGTVDIPLPAPADPNAPAELKSRCRKLSQIESWWRCLPAGGRDGGEGLF